MEENGIFKRKAYYFFIAIIILSGILILYLSCESKSPTEPASSLNNQVAAKSTNNTTTSSSTTTSVRPGNTPTNTTTLITSRTLTTTSTSTTTTTTTSVPTATTTSTAKPTTTIASANITWCNFEGGSNLFWAYYPNCNTTFTIRAGEYEFWFEPQLMNNGEAPAHNVQVILKDVIVSSSSGLAVTAEQDRALFGTIPVETRWCEHSWPSINFKWDPAAASSGDTITLVFVETYSRSKCTLTIRIP
jgi:hypothetical protein